MRGLLLFDPLAGGPRGHGLEQAHAEERNRAPQAAVVAAADESPPTKTWGTVREPVRFVSCARCQSLAATSVNATPAS